MGDLREFVIIRDNGCVLAWKQPGHVCVGDPSLEHVTMVHSHLEGRRDDERHCVGLCIGTNLKPPSHDERELMRAHLVDRYPSCD